MGCKSCQPKLQASKISKQGPIQVNIKLVLYGEAGVGKTSIKRSYKQGAYFNRASQSTLAHEFFQKRLTASTGQIMRVNIWDTNGRERYQSMMPLYFRNASIILLVFDLTDHRTFVRVDYYLDVIKQMIQTSNLILCLVGNKKDLTKDRVTFEEEGQKKATSILNCFYHQTSAFTGEGITQLFQKAVDQLAKIKRPSIP